MASTQMTGAGSESAAMLVDVPRTPVGSWFESAFDWLTENAAWLFDAISTVTEGGVELLLDVLLFPPPLVLVVILAVLGLLARSWGLAIGALLGFGLVVSMQMWVQAMETLALVLVATGIAVALAIPIGILAARNDRVSTVVKPVLDFMQTMPAFVYLVPAVTLFGIGFVPGVVATIIFALPPGVRLTELGIRQVDREIVEAGHAFGSSPGQILRGIQLPLALPTIMAGVNQVIMLALSMAVIAGLVGAQGLGGEVTSSIATLNLGLGFEAGLSVVILAIYLDRLTASIGHGGKRRPLAFMWSRGGRAATVKGSVQQPPEAEMHVKTG
jgi:glycine betaine/proline transport system permease protein